MRVCWNRSTLPVVWGWNGRPVIGRIPASRRFASNRTSNPRSLPEKHSPLSDSTPAGSPHCWLPWQNVVQASVVVASDHGPGTDRDPRVIIDDVEHLHHPGGDDPVHRVDLPALVRCRRLEPSPRPFGSLAWLWFHQPTTHQNPMDRRHRRHRDRWHPMARDATGSWTHRDPTRPPRARSLPRRSRSSTHSAGPSRARQRTPRSLLQTGQTLGPVPGRPLVERLARHARLTAHRRHVHRRRPPRALSPQRSPSSMSPSGHGDHSTTTTSGVTHVPRHHLSPMSREETVPESGPDPTRTRRAPH